MEGDRALGFLLFLLFSNPRSSDYRVPSRTPAPQLSSSPAPQDWRPSLFSPPSPSAIRHPPSICACLCLALSSLETRIASLLRSWLPTSRFLHPTV